jgi:ABC-type multidrug transport system fused ATPase/permease subunit
VKTSIHASKYRGLFISFTILALFGGIVAVSWYGAYLLQNGQSTVGELFSFILYTSFIGGSIAGLGDIYSSLQRSIGASERVLEILEEKDESTTSAQSLKLKGRVEFKNVSFTYPTRTDFEVLKSVDFTVERGERIALVGPSGSGKSTIINLLMRFYSASSGSIEVDNEEVSQFSLTDFRRNIGRR